MQRRNTFLSQHRRDKGIQVLCSISAEHFVWVAVRVLRGAKQADTSVSQLRSLKHCPKCGYRTSETTSAEKCCPDSGDADKLEIGPLYCGSLFSWVFVDAMRGECTEHTSEKASQLLDRVLEECADGPGPEPLGYCCYHTYCGKVANPPKLQDLVTSLQTAGFHATRTHFDPKCIRTNASPAQLESHILSLATICKGEVF